MLCRPEVCVFTCLCVLTPVRFDVRRNVAGTELLSFCLAELSPPFVSCLQENYGYTGGYGRSADLEETEGVVKAADVVKSAYKAFDRRGIGRVSAKVRLSSASRCCAGSSSRCNMRCFPRGTEVVRVCGRAGASLGGTWGVHYRRPLLAHPA